MIKLRVEWHHECPSCGTELVSDFFENAGDQCACPWCGAPIEKPVGAIDISLKDYVQTAIRNIEEEANGRTTTS